MGKASRQKPERLGEKLGQIREGLRFPFSPPEVSCRLDTVAVGTSYIALLYLYYKLFKTSVSGAVPVHFNKNNSALIRIFRFRKCRTTDILAQVPTVHS